MKVIFVEDSAGVAAGTVTDVNGGYARNFLLPRKIAVPATKENLAHLNEKLQEAERRHTELMKLLAESKEKLEKETLLFERKSEQADKLFGSVTGTDIWETLSEKGYQLEKHDIDSPEIDKLGLHTVKVNLGEGVTAQIKVEVKAEGSASG